MSEKRKKTNCLICNESFYPTHSKGQRSCSLECGKKLRKQTIKEKRKYFMSRHFEEQKVKANSKTIINLLNNSKYKITDERVIIENESPTGKAYIGVSKQPLQPAAGFHGYKGVLLQTDNRQFIQCHVCGKWMRRITKVHLDKHSMDKKDYCKEFGLYPNKALVSDAISYQLERAGRITWSRSDVKKTLARLREERKKQKQNKGASASQSVESQNNHGTCEKQIEYRLIEYIKAYKMLPSRSTKGEGGKICKVLHRRYGSINNGFKHYGLPIRNRMGTTVELIAPNGKSLYFNYNKGYSRIKVFKWIIENSKAKL